MKSHPNKERLLAFGQYIRSLRQKRNLSLKEVAKQVNLTLQYLGEIERGMKEPDDQYIRALANFYDEPEDYFFFLLKKIPLQFREELESNPELQELIRQISRNQHLSAEKKQQRYALILKYYMELLAEEE